jgi:hypothetical protein
MGCAEGHRPYSTLQVGLGLLQQDGRVLQCYKSIHDAIWWVPAGLGATAAIGWPPPLTSSRPGAAHASAMESPTMTPLGMTHARRWPHPPPPCHPSPPPPHTRYSNSGMPRWAAAPPSCRLATTSTRSCCATRAWTGATAPTGAAMRGAAPLPWPPPPPPQALQPPHPPAAWLGCAHALASPLCSLTSRCSHCAPPHTHTQLPHPPPPPPPHVTNTTFPPRSINPYADHMYDGVNISPFEVMFVKVKEFLLEAGWATASHAKKYSAWMRGQVGGVCGEGRQGELFCCARLRGCVCMEGVGVGGGGSGLGEQALPPWRRTCLVFFSIPFPPKFIP